MQMAGRFGPNCPILVQYPSSHTPPYLYSVLCNAHTYSGDSAQTLGSKNDYDCHDGLEPIGH